MKCPNCGGRWYNEKTRKCRHCIARAKYGKSTTTIDVIPKIKKDKEEIAMQGVNYETEEKIRNELRNKGFPHHPTLGANS